MIFWILSDLGLGRLLASSSVSARATLNALVSIFIFFAHSSVGWAQTSTDADDDPAGFSVPPLPDYSQGQNPILVSGTEAQSFRSIIPEPLYPAVRAGELSLRVVGHAPWEPTLSNGHWSEAPETDCLEGKGLAPTVLWSRTGFPCGSRVTIQRVESSERDPGRRYLLNAERAVAGSGLSRMEIKVQSVGSSLTNATLRIERVAPHLIATKEPPKGAVMWRERLTWLEPKPINGIDLLTLRFRGPDEDMFFQRSPISGRFRQLTGSNRGDDMLGLALAAADLTVWSSKLEWMESVKLVGFSKVLVPLFGEQRVKLKGGEAGCFEGQIVSGSSSSALEIWASNLVFSPREVVEIEVVSGDPFSLTGKMRVFIDTETMLPVMKIVYDRAGQQERVVIGSVMGLAFGPEQSGTNVNGPIVSLGIRGRISVLSPEFVMVCNGYSQSLSESIFDLRSVVATTPGDATKEPVIVTPAVEEPVIDEL